MTTASNTSLDRELRRRERAEAKLIERAERRLARRERALARPELTCNVLSGRRSLIRRLWRLYRSAPGLCQCCGVEPVGGPSARYCPDCRSIARREAMPAPVPDGRPELSRWPSEVGRLEGKLSNLEMERDLAVGDADRQRLAVQIRVLIGRLEAAKSEAMAGEVAA